jgi:hypothetical protein
LYVPCNKAREFALFNDHSPRIAHASTLVKVRKAAVDGFRLPTRRRLLDDMAILALVTVDFYGQSMTRCSTQHKINENISHNDG